MIDIPNMIMIGGNSRNAGKTTLACNIISRFSAEQEVIGLKVTSIRPEEERFHGNHQEKTPVEFSIFEELDMNSQKDTSKMLKSGASQVFYIRTEDVFIEHAILHFRSKYINNQPIVCESRSLRKLINPGLFLMILKSANHQETKDVSDYLPKADKVFHFGENQEEISRFIASLHFEQGKFTVAK